MAETGPSKPPTTLPAPLPPVGTEPQPDPSPDPRREAIKRFAKKLLEMQKAGIDPRNVPLAAAGTDGVDSEMGEGEEKPSSPQKPAPSPQNDKDRQGEILGKLQEVIDELKKQPDPQAGDIDTAGPGSDAQGETPSRSNDRQPNPSKTGKQEQRKKIDSIVDRFRDLMEAQLENDKKRNPRDFNRKGKANEKGQATAETP